MAVRSIAATPEERVMARNHDYERADLVRRLEAERYPEVAQLEDEMLRRIDPYPVAQPVESVDDGGLAVQAAFIALVWLVAIGTGFEIGRHAHGPGSFGFVWAVAGLLILGAAECTRILYRHRKQRRTDRRLEEHAREVLT